MKILKTKIITLLIAVVALGTLFMGCGIETVKGDKSALAFYNMFIKQDLSDINDIGVTDEDAKSALDTYDTAMKTQTTTNFAKSGFNISSESIDKIVSAEKEMLKKLNADVTIVSEDKTSCQVKVSTTYVNLTEIDQKVANEALKEVQAMNLTSESEAREKLVSIYIDKIVVALQNAQPSSDKKEDTFTFEKKKVDCNGKVKQVYVPTDSTAFGQSIGSMAVGAK